MLRLFAWRGPVFLGPPCESAFRRRSCVSFVGREQAFHQPRAAPKLKWPIFETCPGNCGFVRVAQKRAGALKMPVRSHEEHAIVCQRQGVTLVLATSMQATRSQRPLRARRGRPPAITSHNDSRDSTDGRGEQCAGSEDHSRREHSNSTCSIRRNRRLGPI